MHLITGRNTMTTTLKPIGRLTQAVTMLVLAAMAALPAWSQTLTGGPNVVSPARPFIDQTSSGIPQINITTPNSSGLSHNIFTNFNVGPQGLIFNNSATNVSTQIGGWVEGNPNLRPGGEARIILNEVIGRDISVLAGRIEIAGRRAELIIANEAGIVCNACGFINTSRLTLTTGVPTFGLDGSLSGFNVQQGTVQIAAGGLNALNVDRVDLIARAAQIYGDLKANRLNVITGSNRVDYNTGSITRITGVGTVPTIAIDVSAMGGMYANAIQLMATEQGVGVKVDGTLLSAGNLSISNSGQLTVAGTGRVQATQNVQVASAGPIVLAGALASETQDVLLSSGSSINLGGKTSAARNIVLSSVGPTNILGTVEASNNFQVGTGGVLDISGTVKARNALLNASGDIAISGGVQATDTLQIASAKSVNISNTGTLSATDVVMQSALSTQLAGKITASQGLQLVAGTDIDVRSTGGATASFMQLTSQGSTTISGALQAIGLIEVTSNVDLMVGGTIKGNAITLTSVGTTAIYPGASIEATVLAQLVAGGDANIVGAIKGGDVTIASGGTARLLAPVQATAKLAVTANNVLITGPLLGAVIELTASGDVANLAVINADNLLQITAGGRITNSNVLMSKGSIALFGAVIVNDNGLIWAQDSILMARSGSLNNTTLVANINGRIEAYTGDVIIRADTVTNQGTAPTIIRNGSVTSWYEAAGASAVAPSKDLANIIDASALNADGTVKASALPAYAALWEAVLSGTPPSSAAAAIIKPTALLASGALDPEVTSGWTTMANRASTQGIANPVTFMRDLLIPAALNADGTVKTQYLAAYAQIWQAVADGTAIPASVVALNILKPTKYNTTTNQLDAQYTTVWADMRAGSAAGYTIKYTLFKDLMLGDGKLAEITAGRSVDIRARDVSNIYGTISAGTNVTITANTLTNRALGMTQVLHEVHKLPGCFTCHAGVVKYYDTFGGKIEGTQAVTLNVGTFDNQTIASSDGMATLIGSAGTTRGLVASDQTAGTSAQPTVGIRTTTSAGAGAGTTVAPLTGVAAVSPFQTEVAALQLYLQNPADVLTQPVITPETRPLYTQYGSFVTTQYLRDRLGYQDAQYDNLRWSDALATLGADLRVDSSNIVSSVLQQQMNTPPSGYLNIAAMLPTHTNQTRSENSTLVGGAQISGGTVRIAADSVANSGVIAGSTALTVSSRGDITGSGAFTGGNVTLAALGNISLAADVDRTGGGPGANAGGFMDVARGNAALTASGTLTLNAGGSLTLAGLNVTSGGAADIQAHDSITIASLALQFDRGDHRNTWQRQLGTTLSIGGDLLLRSDADINIRSSELLAHGDMSVEAAQAINIIAGEEYTTSFWTKDSKSSGFLTSKSTHEEWTKSSLTHKPSELDAFGTIKLKAGTDLTVAGSNLNAMDSLSMTAGDEIALTSVLNSAYSKYTSVSKTSLFGFINIGSSSSTTINQSTTNQGSSAKAFADTALASGGSTTVVASQVKAGGDLSIHAGVGPNAKADASVNILAANDSTYFEKEERSSGLFQSSGGTFYLYKKETERTTLATMTNVASVIDAGGNVSIGAARDITVTGSVVTAGLDTALVAGRDVNIVPGAEGRDTTYEHEVSGLGISFSNTKSSASVFAGYMETTDKSSFHGSYTAASLVMAGNDLSIRAGNNISQVGSDLSAENDVWIVAGGQFVSLAAAQREVMDKFHEELRGSAAWMALF
jgi:filamentous hemagglutinin